MRHDKKMDAGTLPFLLARGIGQTFVDHSVDLADVAAFLGRGAMMIGLMTIAFAAAATTPAPLAPSGKWVVDYQKDMCLVSRPFGPADANTILALKPAIAMEEGGETLFVLSMKIGGDGVRRGQAVVTLSPSGAAEEAQITSVGYPKEKFRGYEFEADADFVTSLRDASGISMIAGKDAFAFTTGKMQPVLEALTACNENLFRSWGVDPAARALTVRGVSPADWFPLDRLSARRQTPRRAGRIGHRPDGVGGRQADRMPRRRQGGPRSRRRVVPARDAQWSFRASAGQIGSILDPRRALGIVGRLIVKSGRTAT